MAVIDEKGRIFGVINVVDALVVLLVLAVALAGVALVTGGFGDETAETRYATLDLGDQPDYVRQLIDENDTAELENSPDNITVTDVYHAPTDSGIQTLVRVEINGRTTEEGEFRYDGRPVRVGRTLSIQTDEYVTNGTVRNVGGGAELATETSEVVLRTNVSTDTAEAMADGDEYRIAGQTVGTVESLTVYGTENQDDKQVYLGLTLRTIQFDGQSVLGTGTQIRDGETVPFRTQGYNVSGEIVRVGAVEERGEPAERTGTLVLENVDRDRAAIFSEGMAETAGNDTVARITDVTVEPSTVVLTSEDGQIYEREHPTERDVTMTATLSVRETPTGLQFKGQRIHAGSEITLDLEGVTVRATVQTLED